jgi:ankyrin repeat protein
MIKFILSLFLLASCSSAPTHILEEKEIYFSDTEDTAYNLLLRNDTKKFEQIISSLDFNHVNYIGESFIHGSVSISNINLFKEIINKNGLKNIDRENIFNKSALAYAIDSNDLVKAEILLKLGAKVNQKEFLDNPLFFIPLRNKQIDMLKLLMEYNFDPNITGFMDKTWINFKFAEKEMIDYQNHYNKKNKKL